MLVPPVVESPAVSNSRGEPEPIGKAGNLPGIYHKAVRYAIGNGRNKIILYVSGTPNRTPTEIGFATQSLLRGAGIPTGVVHEGCNSREREAISRAFEKYDTAVLANFMTLTEGFDSTCVDCVILGRRTTSESTLIQMIGRGLRLHAGKEDCLVLDFTGRNDVHDVLSYWRLDGQRDKPEKDRAERSAKVSDDDLDSLQLALPGRHERHGRHHRRLPVVQSVQQPANQRDETVGPGREEQDREVRVRGAHGVAEMESVHGADPEA